MCIRNFLIFFVKKKWILIVINICFKSNFIVLYGVLLGMIDEINVLYWSV